MKRRFTIILFFLLFILFTSCSNLFLGNRSDTSNNSWNGNWYGYIGSTFYKLSFNRNTACLYYASDYGYRPLYEAAVYEYTSMSFNVTFTRSSYGEPLSTNMNIYGTMISGRNDGFYLWNSTDRPFFKLD